MIQYNTFPIYSKQSLLQISAKFYYVKKLLKESIYSPRIGATVFIACIHRVYFTILLTYFTDISQDDWLSSFGKRHAINGSIIFSLQIFTIVNVTVNLIEVNDIKLPR